MHCYVSSHCSNHLENYLACFSNCLHGLFPCPHLVLEVAQQTRIWHCCHTLHVRTTMLKGRKLYGESILHICFDIWSMGLALTMQRASMDSQHTQYIKGTWLVGFLKQEGQCTRTKTLLKTAVSPSKCRTQLVWHMVSIECNSLHTSKRNSTNYIMEGHHPSLTHCGCVHCRSSCHWEESRQWHSRWFLSRWQSHRHCSWLILRGWHSCGRNWLLAR